MKNFTEEQIETMYKNLPNDLKTVFFSANKDETIESIGRKHNLTIDKISIQLIEILLSVIIN